LDRCGLARRQFDKVTFKSKLLICSVQRSNSWEEAAKLALEEAATHLEDLRVAEIEQLDVRMQENKVVEYRARVRASFRYRPEIGSVTRGKIA
jgi:dodecin